jgi:DNA uptake protein ComE-like DNA-binding protein
VFPGKQIQHSIRISLKLFYRAQPAGLQATDVEAENGALRITIRSAAIVCATVVLLGACLTGAAQYKDRDSRGEPRTSAAAPPPEDRVDINHATVSELLKVRGITSTWAGRIVRFRPYHTKADLLDRGIVTMQVYDRIKDYVIAHRDK